MSKEPGWKETVWYAEREELRVWSSSCGERRRVRKRSYGRSGGGSGERVGDLGRRSDEDELGADACEAGNGAGEGLEGVSAERQLHSPCLFCEAEGEQRSRGFRRGAGRGCGGECCENIRVKIVKRIKINLTWIKIERINIYLYIVFHL